MKTVELIRYAVGKLAELGRQTGEFSDNIDAMTDNELTSRVFVSREFLNFLPCLFDVFHPKRYAELRKAIAYLNYMHDAQRDAWGRTLKQFQDDSDLLAAIRQSSDETERLRLIKLYCHGR